MLLERARSSPGSSRNLTPQRSAASTPPRAYSPVSSRPHSAERGVGAYGVRGGAGGGYSPTSSLPLSIPKGYKGAGLQPEILADWLLESTDLSISLDVTACQERS
eukprot:1162016-Pelagomonas_calceolata.AAC.21